MKTTSDLNQITFRYSHQILTGIITMQVRWVICYWICAQDNRLECECVWVCVSTSQFDLPNPSSEHNAITALGKRPVSVCISLFKSLLCCLSITTSTPSCSKFYLKQRCRKTIQSDLCFVNRTWRRVCVCWFPMETQMWGGWAPGMPLDAPPQTSVPAHPVYTQTR